MSKASRARARPACAPEIQPAIALHRQGRLAEAERIYAAILAVDPGRCDALHLLGLANYQQGRLPEALRLMAAALKADPRRPTSIRTTGWRSTPASCISKRSTASIGRWRSRATMCRRSTIAD